MEQWENAFIYVLSTKEESRLNSTQSARGGQQRPFQEFRNSLNAFSWFLAIHNAAIKALFRKPGTCGSNAFGFAAMLGLLVWIPLFCAFSERSFERDNPGVHSEISARDSIGLFMGVYVVMLLCHRIAHARLDPSVRLRIHSHCDGVSVWANKSVSERRARWLSEPLVCLLLGIGLRGHGISFALGSYFLVAAFTLLAEALLIQQVRDAHLRAMRDARLESEYCAQQYREQEGR